MNVTFLNECAADGCYKKNIGKGFQMCDDHQRMYDEGKPFKAFYGKTVLKQSDTIQPITKDQTTIIGTICSRLNIVGENKKVMVAGFSATGKESTKELLYDEAAAFIKHLRDLQGPTDQDAKKAKMIGKIFYYAHEMAWVKTNAAGKRVADGQRVDEWMVKFSYLKKKLNSYKLAELPTLVSQFAQVYKHFLNKH